METTSGDKQSLQKKIESLEEDIRIRKAQLAEIRRKMPAEAIPDYTFTNHENEPVKLSSLFGDKKELILVYNMGKSCRYCTLWADGFVGLTPHLESRAAFVLVSPDSPEVQKEFSRSRGWNFNMLSHAGNTFRKDMGFETEDGSVLPGVSVFTKEEDGSIFHSSSAMFGPGDSYNIMWDFMDLLPSGYNKWVPQYSY